MRGGTTSRLRSGASGLPPARVSPDRVLGIDLARGLALLGMIAVHVFDTFGNDGNPTPAYELVAGRSLATFVLVAGISLWFATGRRKAPGQRGRLPTAAAVATRALLVGAIGLALNYSNPPVDVILPYYAVFFLVAIPLLGLRRPTLVTIVAALTVVAPLVVLASFGPDPATYDRPTFGTLLHPAGLALTLIVAGTYPAVEYLAYVCAGLAIGRLDLSSRRVAAWLFAGGASLAVLAWAASSTLLFHLGGLQHLRDAADSGLSQREATNTILWDPQGTYSWWWLVERAPYTTTPLTMLHVLGCATAVVGAALLLMRVRFIAGLLWPVAAAGSMTLTLYSVHVLILATGWLGNQEQQLQLYAVLVGGVLAFAVLWRRFVGQGPLEWLVATVAAHARRGVARVTR
jgi:uncharacterized membrane protein